MPEKFKSDLDILADNAKIAAERKGYDYFHNKTKDIIIIDTGENEWRFTLSLGATTLLKKTGKNKYRRVFRKRITPTGVIESIAMLEGLEGKVRKPEPAKK